MQPQLTAFFRSTHSIALSRPKVILSLVLLLTVLSGAAYTIHLGSALRFPDEHQYIRLAENLLESGTYSLDGTTPTAFRAPGYSLLLTVPLLLKAGIAGCRMINFLALALSMALLYRLLFKTIAPNTALLSVVLAFCYPVMFYTAGTLYPQTVGGTLLLAILNLSLGGGETERQTGSPRFPAFAVPASAGVLTGILILTIPTFVFFAAFLCAWTAWNVKTGSYRRTAILLVAAGLTVSPWICRNYRAFDRFIPLSTNGGYNLLLGNSEHTTPNAGVNVDLSEYAGRTRGMSEAEGDREFARAAFEWIRAHPARAGRLYLLKFLNYFNFRNTLRTAGESSSFRNTVMLLTYGPLPLLFLFRLAMWRRWPPGAFERFAVLLYLLNGAFAAIFFTRIRFRLPFDYLLIAVAAITCARAWSAIAIRRAAKQTAP